jgi:hypothetical protein
LSRSHSHLAESFASFMATQPGWLTEPEVSFAVYGERGVVDQLAWNEAAAHLLVIELKTEFVDINAMLGTLDRKIRLARTIGATRQWRADLVSAWLIVAETHTNRRHAAQHSALLRSRFAMDGRALRKFLRNPSVATTGLAFWPYANGGSAGSNARPTARAKIGPQTRSRANQPHNRAGQP